SVRFTVYTWAFDPLVETDTTHDYYVVFVSAAVQGKGGWCLANGSTFTDPFNGQTITPPSEKVSIDVANGEILTDKVTPTNLAHGDELATLGFNLGLTLGAEPGSNGGLGAGVSAGISWSQSIFAWTTRVTSLSSSDVIWETTISKPLLSMFFQGADCNQEAWICGYGLVVGLHEGKVPLL